MNSSLITGASQGIGLALSESLLSTNCKSHVLATHRKTSSLDGLQILKKKYQDRLELCEIDINDEVSFANLSDRVIDFFPNGLDLIINCIGFLHQENHRLPERKIVELNSDFLMKSFKVNCLPTLLLAKHLAPTLKSKKKLIFCSISAKVGSISDNKLGGWYSYRASKAALNMAIKNISIEFGRMNPQFAAVALHPGTTKTSLSEPFLAHAEKKYTVHSTNQTAENLLGVIKSLKTPRDNGKFFSWDGSEIGW